jgi:hypothetical protein
MKTKLIILIAISAVLTFSFTFSTSTKSENVVKAEPTTTTVYSEPAGGFISEDKF